MLTIRELEIKYTDPKTVYANHVESNLRWNDGAIERGQVFCGDIKCLTSLIRGNDVYHLTFHKYGNSFGQNRNFVKI